MVKLNGKEENIAVMNLAECIAEYGFNSKRIVVEINGDIVPKTDYEKVTISDNDVIEVVSFVGGG